VREAVSFHLACRAIESEEWATLQRERLHSLAIEVLQELATA
jgi:hypothetical protein